MTIARKIILASIAQILLILSLAAISIVTGRVTRSTIGALVGDSLPGIYSIGRMNSLSRDIRGGIRNHITLEKLEAKKAQENDVAALERQFRNELVSYERSVTTGRDRELYRDIATALDRFLASGRQAIENSNSLSPDAMPFFRSRTLAAYQELQAAVDAASTFKMNNAKTNAGEARDSVATGHLWTWAILAISLAAGGVLSLSLIRTVHSSVRQIAAELRASAEQVAHAAGELSTASQSQSQGASEQAAALEESAASCQEVSSITSRNAERAASSAAATAQVKAKIAEANRTLADMVSSMKAINDSSDKIAKIIRVIDEIAFQTNILALNAAVEAARAGEAGMGFAVVADEVRNLAHRSSQAAKDTAALIEESIHRAKDGRLRLDGVANAITAITASAGEVETTVDEVNQSSREQAVQMDEIARGIAQMEQVTQSSAASAEESAALSTELFTQAESMRRGIGELQALLIGNA